MVALVNADPFNYEALNYASFEAHNLARTNPQAYAKMAQDELDNKFVYDRNGNPTRSICLAPDFTPKSNVCYYTLSTQEGAKAWKEAVTALNSAPSGLQPLQWSEGLAQACYDHIRDSGPSGLTGHTGSDGSSPDERVRRYIDATMTGENLAYSDAQTGTDMILQLLVDDGVPDRGHRHNILEKEFTHIGISCGCHTQYTEMCCYAYGRDVKEKNPSKKADVAPQLERCSSYSPNTRGTTSSNFNVGAQNTPKKNTAEAAKPQVNPNSVPSHSPSQVNNFDDYFPGLFGHYADSGKNNPNQFGDNSHVGSQNYNNDWGIGDWSWDYDNWFDSNWEFGSWSEDLTGSWHR